MNFNRHSNLEGSHAFLSASKYHWINYDKEKLTETFLGYIASQRGTELHAFAEQCIKLNQKLPKSRNTLNSYVNDAIGYMMTPEQPLYYSDNCFGTADAISFDDNFLRIHDLKTGDSPGHMEQLYIYAALFCLEYGFDPSIIKIELRIYQSNNIVVDKPSSDLISSIMEKIVEFDHVINELKKGEN